MRIKHLWTFFFLASFALLQGCFGGSQPEEDPNATGLGADGDYEVCSYTNGLSSDGYRSARMTYPCDLSDGPFPATTLTGGFTNTKEQMEWLSNHLTSHGYVVLTMTPTNTLGNPPIWKKAHLAGFAKLAEENARLDSPVMLNIAQDKRAITGFSMGGGGTLLAAGELGQGFATAIALAPYLGSNNPNYANIDEPVLVLGSAEDILAPASSVASYYQTLPADITRALAIYKDTTHFQWYGSGDPLEKTKFKVLVTAWLDYYVKNDASARSYFDGAKHAEHEANDWFTQFEYRP
ncbi:MAG: alpha/beta hydrolase-fold protein [Alcanivoracaceae bacterium]|nr:alpha/beta hydrolase-fold protein [Alcanivoracaceae bacterium]